MIRRRRQWQRKLSLIICVWLCSGLGGKVYGADAESFRTPEYNASTGLELIRTADAYALGYTGKGITLGICDEFVKLSHPEFSSKLASDIILDLPADYSWIQYTHGTHVGGIMAATKDNVGMHGVAFDADLVSGTFRDVKPSYEAFNKNKQVKIINNSWAFNTFPDETSKYIYLPVIKDYADTIKDSIVNYDKVVVFSAGNYGHPTPNIMGILPYLDRATATNFINVINIDSSQYDRSKNTTSIKFVHITSDLVKYVEENSIASPGTNINSAFSKNDGYKLETGTSMAAPYVSGAAGLVQQAFPYMTGKQIVDTVLSTAKRDFALPDYTVTVQKDVQSGGKYHYNVNVYYFDLTKSKPDADTIKQNLIDYYKANEMEIFSYYPIDTETEFLALDKTVYEKVPREMVFGQGLLDVGAAVGGPGLLNARRMDKSNYSVKYSAGNKDLDNGQALYKVDTQGYNSIWSNNISETRAGLLAVDSKYADLKAIYNYYKQCDELLSAEMGSSYTEGHDYIEEYNEIATANGLLDLPVGLYKSGEGILILKGTNDYKGTSVAAGGVLQIDGRVAGDAWSVDSGTIAGKGTISRNLTNRSIVQAGSYDITDPLRPVFRPGTLYVGGNLTSTGTIAVAANSTTDYSKLVVAGSGNINGTTFAAVTGSTYQPGATYQGVVSAAGGMSGTFQTSGSAFTGMLSAEASHNGTRADLTLTRANNLGSSTAKQLNMFTRIQTMYTTLQGQTAQRELDPLYSLNPTQAKQALTEIYGGAQLNQAYFAQRDTMVGTAITARLQSVQYNREVTVNLPGFAPGNFAVKTVIPMELDADNSWWMKISKNWGSSDAAQDVPSLTSQSYSYLVGQDKKVSDHWRTGFIVGYGQNDVTSSQSKTANRGYRLGLYGGYLQGAVDVQTYLEYGKQTNTGTRYLNPLNLQANSRYDSSTLRFGMAARYNLAHAQDKVWQVRPYADMNVTRYTQDSYMESGAGVYDQQADKLSNTYSTGEIGLELTRKIPKGRYGISLGYKKVLSGSNPDMTVALRGDASNKLVISGNEQDREYVVMGLHYQGQMGKGWTLDGQLNSEKGKSSHNLTASLVARLAW